MMVPLREFINTIIKCDSSKLWVPQECLQLSVPKALKIGVYIYIYIQNKYERQIF